VAFTKCSPLFTWIATCVCYACVYTRATPGATLMVPRHLQFATFSPVFGFVRRSASVPERAGGGLIPAELTSYSCITLCGPGRASLPRSDRVMFRGPPGSTATGEAADKGAEKREHQVRKR
jgi:hypothetical protein